MIYEHIQSTYSVFFMAKGFAPAPESPERQTQPTERKLAVDAEQVQEQWLSHFQAGSRPTR